VVKSFHYDLSGRVALVTGASSGLGERFARILAESGAKVVLGARRLERLEQTVADIEAAGGEALAVAMDATDEASIKQTYDAAEARFGMVDTIFANAGSSAAGPALKLPVDAFDDLMALNLRGPFLTAREGAKRLIAAGSAEKMNGRVILTASLIATAVESGLAAYGATKAGVVQMGRILAREWLNKGINVNSICPGYIKTELNGAWFESEGGKKQIASFNRQRLIREDALDPLILWLASDASEAVTGTSFIVDDGQGL
jgi:NAD(P)-dependent dehydrogenase (short-subunit alcohol dehydrogenase family)